jgi:hypothetical protein
MDSENDRGGGEEGDREERHKPVAAHGCERVDPWRKHGVLDVGGQVERLGENDVGRGVRRGPVVGTRTAVAA